MKAVKKRRNIDPLTIHYHAGNLLICQYIKLIQPFGSSQQVLVDLRIAQFGDSVYRIPQCFYNAGGAAAHDRTNGTFCLAFQGCIDIRVYLAVFKCIIFYFFCDLLQKTAFKIFEQEHINV